MTTQFVELLQEFENTSQVQEDYDRKLNVFLFSKIQKLEEELKQIKAKQEELYYKMGFLIDDAGNIQVQLKEATK